MSKLKKLEESGTQKMEQTIDKIIKALSQAFDMGTKTAQDLYPMFRQEWVVYNVFNVLFIVCLCVLLTLAVVFLFDLLDLSLLKNMAIKCFVLFIVFTILAIIFKVLQIVFASDYMIFLQLIGGK